MAVGKEIKTKIASVQSTQKITRAMEMVAASKMRKTQERVLAARPYAKKMSQVIRHLAQASSEYKHAYLSEREVKRVGVILISSDRGLCGGFNSNIVKEARNKARELIRGGKEVKIYCIGRKSRDQLKREFGSKIIGSIEDIAKPSLSFDKAASVADRVLAMFDAGEFDVCTIFYAKFQSIMAQIPTAQQLIPFESDAGSETSELADGAVYDYEPSDEKILSDLLPRNISVQIFKTMLENAASEHGARMSAMDSATRNAGEMIDSLSIKYNRTRQANITNELIEIISAKEAL